MLQTQKSAQKVLSAIGKGLILAKVNDTDLPWWYNIVIKNVLLSYPQNNKRLHCSLILRRHLDFKRPLSSPKRNAQLVDVVQPKQQVFVRSRCNNLENSYCEQAAWAVIEIQRKISQLSRKHCQFRNRMQKDQNLWTTLICTENYKPRFAKNLWFKMGRCLLEFHKKG